jgi:heme A synthase
MESIRSGPLAAALAVFAVVFALLAVLYGLGVIQFLTSNPQPGEHHPTHAFLFAVLFVASLVAANLVRPRAD